MAKLAIKGDKKRGKQIIKLLETLGGKNTCELHGTNDVCAYIIEPTPESDIECRFLRANGEWKVFTIDNFLCRFPYNVGDKVIFNGNVELINRMRWDGETIKYGFFTTKGIGEATAKDLQPYKEGTMEKKISSEIINRFICLEGFEFYDDKGNIINTKEIIMKKKQPQYPKTYEECCKIIHSDPNFYIDTHLYSKKLDPLYKLLICRDAYWKIDGDWRPDRVSVCHDKFYIENIPSFLRDLFPFRNIEMRDAFYENFKELIESCKGFL